MTAKKEKEDKEPEDMEQEAAIKVESVEATEKPVKEKDDATELLKAMAVAAVIALVIRSFLFEPFNIPSSSMYPTLMIGDYLFVKKWTYGYSRYSFPLDIIPFNGRFFDTAPVRGDVVVFRQPKKEGVDYIKRLIGMPGDRIQVKHGRLYINGKIIPREPDRINPVEPVADEEGTRMFNKYIETLPPDAAHPDGVKHYIYEISDSGELDNTPEYTVPEGHYFMMGDNRDRSLDSRVSRELGFVPADNFIGPATILFFSTEGLAENCDREGILASIQSTGCKIAGYAKAIRFSRMFRLVSGL